MRFFLLVSVTWVGEAKLVLQGHRSIVNQVRFNTCTHNIVSSGVEKIIKVSSQNNQQVQ